MRQWIGMLCGLFVVGCGNETPTSEGETYRIAPHLVPASTCVECQLSLAMWAEETMGDGAASSSAPDSQFFTPEQFSEAGLSFQWGVEQLVEFKVEHYDPGELQDVSGVRFHFLRVVKSVPVEPGARFKMRFDERPPGTYSEDFLVREGEGFRMDQRVSLVCATAELCEQLALRRPGEEAFVLEFAYPESEGAPLRLHSIQDVP